MVSPHDPQGQPGDQARGDSARVTPLRLELPEPAMAQLRAAAQRHGRSPSAEVIVLLQEAVVSAADAGWARMPVRQARLVQSAGLHVEVPEALAERLRELAHLAHRSLGVETALLLQRMLKTIQESGLG
jgi:hypothetical protein